MEKDDICYFLILTVIWIITLVITFNKVEIINLLLLIVVYFQFILFPFIKNFKLGRKIIYIKNLTIFYIMLLFQLLIFKNHTFDVLFFNFWLGIYLHFS